MSAFKNLKNKFSLKKKQCVQNLQRKFVFSKFATIKRLAKLNKEELWKLFLEKNYNYPNKENVNKWLPKYLVNHANYVYGKYSEVPLNFRDRTFISACNVAYKCEVFNILPIILINSDDVRLPYMDFEGLDKYPQKNISLNLFTHFVHKIGSYEVTALVPNNKKFEKYNIDVYDKILNAIEDEVVGYIDKLFTDSVRKLGEKNAKIQFENQDTNLNLYFGEGTINSEDFEYGDFYNSEINGEQIADIITRQRKISSRILAAANTISVSGRLGRANLIILNPQIAASIQDCPSFVYDPFTNYIDDAQKLYHFGSFAGIDVYVDPYMDWEDTRITLGYVSTTSSYPGVYILLKKLLADLNIEVKNEKEDLLITDVSYKFEELGKHPEYNWITFFIKNDENIDLI